MTTFAISYDSAQMQNVEQQLNAFVQSNRYVFTWAKPFNGCILVRTNLDRITLYENLRTFFPPSAPFFVAETSSSQASGTLPQHVWTWLNSADVSALLAFGAPPPAPSDS
ncbi:hypothetical protein [Sphingomonas sp. 3-13AW]|uniref:hypothetical protein n=1 Tax=Sphingomonas sp. 3-13AW TaxID=3050450 RepID=UPI003BB7D86F